MIKHLAIIMDGNRRWAKKNALSYSIGYREGGSAAIRTALDFALAKGIKFLSLYTFSLENFKRPEEEKDFIFQSLIVEGEKNLPYLKKYNVKACFIGDRSTFPACVIPTITAMEDATKNNTALQLNILFCYGSQQEIVFAVKRMINDVKAGILDESSITEKTVADYLWTHGIPDPELIIRTSGIQRLSNFLSYQSAYSEIFFLKCLWPEITEQDLQTALDSYTGVQRNFGV